LEAVENGSVVTWAHFNLHGDGEFDFSDEKIRLGCYFPKIHPQKRLKFWRAKIGFRPYRIRDSENYCATFDVCLNLPKDWLYN